MDKITINDNTSSVVCERIVTKEELNVGTNALKSKSKTDSITIDAPVAVTGNFVIGESSTMVLGDLDGSTITGLIGGWKRAEVSDESFGQFDTTSGLLVTQPFTASAGVPNRFVDGNRGQSWSNSSVSKELVKMVRPPPTASEKVYFARHNTATGITTCVEKTADFFQSGGVGTPSPLTFALTLGNGNDGETLAFRPDTNELVHFSGTTVGQQFMEPINPDTLVIGPNKFPGNDATGSGSVDAAAWNAVLQEWYTIYDNTTWILPPSGDPGSFYSKGSFPEAPGGISFVGSQYYMVARNSPTLYEANPANVSIISTTAATGGSFGPPLGFRAMDYDVINGIMYVIYVSGISAIRLGRIDLTTGVVTDVSGLSNTIEGMAFDNAGRLWLVSGDMASPPETLYRIDGLVGYGGGSLTNQPAMSWDAPNNRWLVAWDTTYLPSGIHVYAMDGTSLAVTDLTTMTSATSGPVCGTALLGNRFLVFVDGTLNVHKFNASGNATVDNVAWAGSLVFSGSEDFLYPANSLVFRAAAYDPSGKVWLVLNYSDGDTGVGGTLIGYMLAAEIPNNLVPFTNSIYVTTHMPKKILHSLTWMA